MTIHVLHHNDSDGRFAGYAAWLFHSAAHRLDVVKFYEVQYGKPCPITPEELTKHDEVYILDFSYTKAVLNPLYEAAGKLVVLDHHDTAEEELKGTPYSFFDKSKSGALLAWEYFFPDEEPPTACKLVDDRDLWLWKYAPQTQAFQAWLMFDRVGRNWEKWHELCNSRVAMDQALTKGMLVYKHELSILNSFTSNPDNYRVITAPLPQKPLTHIKPITFAIYNGNQVMISELAQAFYTTMDIQATIDWRCRGDVVTFSVRSPNIEKFSARQYCEYHGGGGHDKAASFSMSRSEAFAYIDALMNGEAPKDGF